MIDLIQRNWNNQQQVTGETIVRFTIQRDGSLVDVGVIRTSRYVALDLASQRAVLLTAQLPALPSAFSEDSLTVRLVFQYLP